MVKSTYVWLLGALAIGMLLGTCDRDTPTSHDPTPPGQVPAMSMQGGHRESPPLPLLARVEALEAAVEALEALHGVDSDADGFLDEEDCAPFDPSIFPGATEICGDGIDQDCDSIIDNPDICNP